MPVGAEVSVLPIVPRSDTYRHATRMLTAMTLAVPPGHPDASEMLDELQGALRAVDDAASEGRYFGGLRVSLPIALQIDEFNVGRPHAVNVVSWMDHGGDWPEWNRCTAQPVS